MIKITHHIEFNFKDREASDLEKLNRILASMKLEKLELKNSRGYLAVTLTASFLLRWVEQRMDGADSYELAQADQLVRKITYSKAVGMEYYNWFMMLYCAHRSGYSACEPNLFSMFSLAGNDWMSSPPLIEAQAP